MKLRLLSLSEVLFIHSAIIDETGGSHGIRDEGLLQSAVQQIEQTFGGKHLYPTLLDKAAALFISLLKNHPFVDGNKRTAVVALGVFLELNRHPLKIEPISLAEWVEKMAANPPNRKAVLLWLRTHTR